MLAAAWSPDGRQIVSGSADGNLRRWDPASGNPIGEAMYGHRLWVSSVAFSADGRHIASGSWDHKLRLWQADSGVPIGPALEGHASQIQKLNFRPGGQHLQSVDRNGALHLWAAPPRWPDMLCAKLTRNMSTSQWRRWVSPDIPYIKQCSKLPEAPD